MTLKSSFDAVKTDWLDSIRKCADENISGIFAMISLLVIIVAGNKCDMVQDRCVPQEV